MSKKYKRTKLDPKPSTKDIYYYLNNGKMVYYGTFEGTGKTLQFQSMDSLEKSLNRNGL